MPNTRLHYGPTILCVLAVVSYLAACGGGKGVDGRPGKGKDSFACGDQTVDVVPGDGTTPKDVYLCDGDTLTWNPNGHTFMVTFPTKYPFKGSPTTFQNDPKNPNSPVKSPAAKNEGKLVVYHYDIVVDGTKATDPQVVGGGSHSN